MSYKNNFNIRKILNTTFILLFCYFAYSLNSLKIENLTTSLCYKKSINQGDDKNSLNITINQGNLTIKDDNYTFSAENLNMSLAKALMNDMEKSNTIPFEEIKPLNKNKKNEINKNQKTFKLPKFMNKSPRYIGNGNFIYSNLINGHSLTIHINGYNSTVNEDKEKVNNYLEDFLEIDWF